MCKRVTGVNDGPFKRQALTFMNSDSPCQTDGILPEYSFYFFRNFLCIFVQHIFIIPPFFGQQLKNIRTIFSAYSHPLCIYAYHFANHTVIISFFRRNIVFEEHNLCTFLDGQHFVSRIRVLREISLYLSPKAISPSGQRCQFTVIHLLCLIVMRCQPDIAFLLPGMEAGLITAVQFIQHFIIRFILAYLIQ